MEAGLRLLREFLRAHPARAAAELERIDPQEAAAVLADAPPEDGAPVLRLMGALQAAEALERMEVPSAVALLCRLESPVAATLMRRLTMPARRNISFVCPEPWKAAIDAALLAPASSVAAFMDVRAPVFPLDWKVSELVEYMTLHPSRLALEAFVAGRDHKLQGRIDLRGLEGRLNVRELRGVMAPNPPSLPLRAPMQAVREDALWRRFDVLPVVDESGLFAGSLSHRTLRVAHKPDAAGRRTTASGAIVELAELAWTGYVAAVEVASSLTQDATHTEGMRDVQED